MLQSERTLLFDAMKTELLEKIRRLEEDRQNIDFTSGTHTMQAITTGKDWPYIPLSEVIKLHFECDMFLSQSGVMR